ncbi:MAG: hypothetical protein LUC31_00330 [Coprobacillus sp.]|nr:hypothetical protein [Coprobacillus sp.]
MAKIKDPAKSAQKKKTRRPGITLFEITWYTICGVVMAWGLTYMVLGLIADYTDISGLIRFSDTIKRCFGMSALYWGILILAIGAIAIAIALLCVARVVDREVEKKSRREARLAHLKELEEEDRLASEAPIVDAEIEPVSEEVPVEETIPEPVVEEAPVEEVPTEEPVVEETSTVEAPVEEPVVEEAPAEEPVVDAIVEEPTEEAPVEETTPEPEAEPAVEETPVEEPVVEIPVEEPVVEETPVVETPVEEPTPEVSEEAPTEQEVTSEEEK